MAELSARRAAIHKMLDVLDELPYSDPLLSEEALGKAVEPHFRVILSRQAERLKRTYDDYSSTSQPSLYAKNRAIRYYGTGKTYDDGTAKASGARVYNSLKDWSFDQNSEPDIIIPSRTSGGESRDVRIDRSVVKDSSGASWIAMKHPGAFEHPQEHKEPLCTMNMQALLSYLDLHAVTDLYGTDQPTKRVILVEMARPGGTEIGYMSHLRSLGSDMSTRGPFQKKHPGITVTETTLPSGRSFHHYQVMNWPNLGVVAPHEEEALCELGEKIAQTTSESDGPAVVIKCLYGIGRTGTMGSIVAAFHLMGNGGIASTRIESELEPLVPAEGDHPIRARAVDEVNESRRAIETPEQYALVLRMIEMKERKMGLVSQGKTE